MQISTAVEKSYSRELMQYGQRLGKSNNTPSKTIIQHALWYEISFSAFTESKTIAKCIVYLSTHYFA